MGVILVDDESLPSRGAWIEILAEYQAGRGALRESLPSRGAWIEIGGEAADSPGC